MSSASRVSDSLTVHPASGREPSRGREGSISRARSPIVNWPRECWSTTSRSSATICSYRDGLTLPMFSLSSGMVCHHPARAVARPSGCRDGTGPAQHRASDHKEEDHNKPTGTEWNWTSCDRVGVRAAVTVTVRRTIRSAPARPSPCTVPSSTRRSTAGPTPRSTGLRTQCTPSRRHRPAPPPTASATSADDAMTSNDRPTSRTPHPDRLPAPELHHTPGTDAHQPARRQQTPHQTRPAGQPNQGIGNKY